MSKSHLEKLLRLLRDLKNYVRSGLLDSMLKVGAGDSFFSWEPVLISFEFKDSTASSYPVKMRLLRIGIQRNLVSG